MQKEGMMEECRGRGREWGRGFFMNGRREGEAAQ